MAATANSSSSSSSNSSSSSSDSDSGTALSPRPGPERADHRVAEKDIHAVCCHQHRAYLRGHRLVKNLRRRHATTSQSVHLGVKEGNEGTLKQLVPIKPATPEREHKNSVHSLATQPGLNPLNPCSHTSQGLNTQVQHKPTKARPAVATHAKSLAIQAPHVTTRRGQKCCSAQHNRALLSGRCVGGADQAATALRWNPVLPTVRDRWGLKLNPFHAI
jgi:hypothetical protein